MGGRGGNNNTVGKNPRTRFVFDKNKNYNDLLNRKFEVGSCLDKEKEELQKKEEKERILKSKDFHRDPFFNFIANR